MARRRRQPPAFSVRQWDAYTWLVRHPGGLDEEHSTEAEARARAEALRPKLPAVSSFDLAGNAWAAQTGAGKVLYRVSGRAGRFSVVYRPLEAKGDRYVTSKHGGRVPSFQLQLKQRNKTVGHVQVVMRWTRHGVWAYVAKSSVTDAMGGADLRGLGLGSGLYHAARQVLDALVAQFMASGHMEPGTVRAGAYGREELITPERPVIFLSEAEALGITGATSTEAKKVWERGRAQGLLARGRRDAADDLLATHDANTKPHPYERGWRVWPNGVEVHLQKVAPTVRKDTVLFHAIKNEYDNPGAASAVLDQIGKWADALGVGLIGTAKPFTRMEGALTAKQLRDWYARHGWVQRRGRGPFDMIRHPDLLGGLFGRRAVRLGPRERRVEIDPPADQPWASGTDFRYRLLPAGEVGKDVNMAWPFDRGPTPLELSARPEQLVLVIDYIELPELRMGWGWAGRFVRAAERWAKQQGAVASTLYSAKTPNFWRHSRGFWAALGYVAVPGLQDDDGEDAIMVRRL